MAQSLTGQIKHAKKFDKQNFEKLILGLVYVKIILKLSHACECCMFSFSVTTTVRDFHIYKDVL